MVDNALPNNNIIYYRIKSNKNDNTYEYSKIVAVKKQTNNNLSIYPNPVTNDFIITDIIEHANLKILDNTGKLVQRISNVNSGYRVNVQSLPAGTYTIHLLDKVDSDQIKSTTFIKN